MNHSVNIQLGKAIEERRLALSLSVDEAAQSIGISPKDWENYERAVDVVPVGRLVFIANALNMHPYQFFKTTTVKPGAFSKDAFEIFYLWRSIKDPEQKKKLLDIAREMVKSI